jgi:hypothetical protein
MRRRRQTKPSGSIYVIVVGTSAIVASIALFSLMTLRTQSIGKDLTRDRLQAELMARGMVDIARLLMENDSSWRSNRSVGTWVNFTSGIASAQVEVQDTDGNLNDDPMDGITITGTASIGNARQKCSMTMYTSSEPLAAITSPIYANNSVTVGLFQRITVTGGPIFSNGSITNLGTITGDTLSNTYSGSNPSGTRTTGAQNRPLPSSSVMSYYEGIAQTVAYTGDWDKRVLAPGINFGGATQADGVYKIDTGGNDLEIKDTRIHGTLIVRCGSGKIVRLMDRCLLQPARADYPVLITDGSVSLHLKSGLENLTEAGIGINFNPPNAPYQSVSDSDTSDVYPNEVQGLVHARANIWLNEDSRVHGALLAEQSFTIFVGKSHIHYDPNLATNPPIGYRNFKMKVQPLSWRRVVD